MARIENLAPEQGDRDAIVTWTTIYGEAVKQAKAETGLPLEEFPIQCRYELAKV